MDRSIRQKPSREIRELIKAMNQMDLTDIYRTFHPNRKEYTFFSAAHGTFSKIDHILGNKANFHSYKKNTSNHLRLSRSPWIKVRIHQQCYPQEAYKIMETETHVAGGDRCADARGGRRPARARGGRPADTGEQRRSTG